MASLPRCLSSPSRPNPSTDLFSPAHEPGGGATPPRQLRRPSPALHLQPLPVRIPGIFSSPRATPASSPHAQPRRTPLPARRSAGMHLRRRSLPRPMQTDDDRRCVDSPKRPAPPSNGHAGGRPPRRAALRPSPARTAPQRLGGRSGWRRSHAWPGGAAVGARNVSGRAAHAAAAVERVGGRRRCSRASSSFARLEVCAHYHRYLDFSGETQPTRGAARRCGGCHRGWRTLLTLPGGSLCTVLRDMLMHENQVPLLVLRKILEPQCASADEAAGLLACLVTELMKDKLHGHLLNGGGRCQRQLPRRRLRHRGAGRRWRGRGGVAEAGRQRL